VDVPVVIRRRLKELGLGQKDLAAAVHVTESYISQLLTRKRAAPAPARTDIYEKIGEFLKLPTGELSRLAELQRREDLKKRVAELPPPLFTEWREMLVRKCEADKRSELSRVFEKEPFSPLERLVTQKLLGVAQGVVREALESEHRLQVMCRLRSRSDEQTRLEILDFLNADVFNITVENWVSLLDSIVEKWDIDLETFGIRIVLNRTLMPDNVRRFEFIERQSHEVVPIEPGFEEFLNDAALSGGATGEEIAFLKALKFTNKRPTAMYYYRELQNLRDPLHFRASASEGSR
jgi:transcriptional regulator with XRE-family HTH domain